MQTTRQCLSFTCSVHTSQIMRRLCTVKARANDAHAIVTSMAIFIYPWIWRCQFSFCFLPPAGSHIKEKVQIQTAQRQKDMNIINLRSSYKVQVCIDCAGFKSGKLNASYLYILLWASMFHQSHYVSKAPAGLRLHKPLLCLCQPQGCNACRGPSGFPSILPVTVTNARHAEAGRQVEKHKVRFNVKAEVRHQKCRHRKESKQKSNTKNGGQTL